jgi:hypothetical protein
VSVAGERRQSKLGQAIPLVSDVFSDSEHSQAGELVQIIQEFERSSETQEIWSGKRGAQPGGIFTES